MQCVSFISGVNAVGSLHYTNPSNNDIGFLLFLHLVGTCYFKKHISTFNCHKTPVQLYNSVDDTVSVAERHKLWVQKIRETFSNRIFTEEDHIPTYTSLWRYWLRSSWVQHSGLNCWYVQFRWKNTDGLIELLQMLLHILIYPLSIWNIYFQLVHYQFRAIASWLS